MNALTPAAAAAAHRRTFAIISHPDAGKTTLTEKLLLLGGAIHLAGEVKAKGERRRARSDWMKIEQERGISVTTSVMTFQRQGITYNLLDTPGHEDFSEDTYRTLTAVDSAVMVIDAARGIETQTLKLFEVCRLRDIPITTFVNKMDREARDPFEIMDEVAETLALDVTPLSWPIGMGREFLGCYDLVRDRLILMKKDGGGEIIDVTGLDDPALEEHLPAERVEALRDEAGLAKEACPPFDMESYRAGHLTPVFFGSALRNFGVAELLQGIGDNAPPPRTQATDKREIAPGEDKVTGFVFKVQANMDPKHRDRIAFMRICSGRFNRGMKLNHIRSGKQMAVHNPILFFAEDRELADEAWPGDIIGVPNHGTLRVGDTLSESENIRFTGIPNFAPEILRRVRLDDPMKSKHLGRALVSLAEEGVTQVFKRTMGGDWIVGVVGQLQLDVLVTRVEQEYGVKISLEPAPFQTARWVYADDKATLDKLIKANTTAMAEDGDGQPVFLARNSWELNYQQEQNPKVQFSATKERA
jgi:peptide chain release factor 3